MAVICSYSFFIGKIQKGQGRFLDVITFNLFLSALLPAFLFFSSLMLAGRVITIYISFITCFILLVIYMRAQYKGIKTIHYLTPVGAFFNLIISSFILVSIFGLFYLYML